MGSPFFDGVSFIPSDLIESSHGTPVRLVRTLSGMVGGDAVALTVPKGQRLCAAVSDLLPSD